MLCKLAKSPDTFKDFPIAQPTLRDHRQAHNSLQARARRHREGQDDACGEGCNGLHVSAKLQVNTT